MKTTFYIERNEVSEIKKMIRSRENIRFLSNPFQLYGKVEIRIEGPVNEMNSLQEEREARFPREELTEER